MEKKSTVKKLWILIIAICAIVVIVASSFAIPAVRNFVFGEWVTTIEPTCENEGEQQRTNCFNKTQSRVVATLGHDFDINVVNPDCINDGYTTYDCKRCDALYDADFVRSNGHNYGEWEVVRVATCTNNGLEKQVCQTCEKTNTQVIYSVGHKYKPTAEELDNTADIKYVCSICDDTIIQSADEQIPVNVGNNLLFDVALDFSFDIITSESEKYIRENLKIILECLEDTEYEDSEDSIQQYILTSKGNNVWTVSPATSYKHFVSYKAKVSGDIKFADYHSDIIIFKTIIDENHEDIYEYNEDIIFLSQLEANAPGYYPYTVTETENGEFMYLNINKAESLYVGDILCVGDVDSVDDLYTAEEYIFGKIKSIQPLQDSKWLIVLEAPTLSEVFSALDIMSSGDIAIPDESFDEEAIGNAFVNALYADEDFHEFLGSVNVAAVSYASKNGYDTTSIKNISSFMDKLNLKPSVQKNKSGNGFVGTITGDIQIPLKDTNLRDIGSINVSFTVRAECSFALNRTCTINWDWAVPDIEYLDISITQTNLFDFDFGVEMDIDYSLQANEYLQNKTSGKIHRRGCTHVTSSSNPQNFTGISIMHAQRLIAEKASLECKQCKPSEGFINGLLLINKEAKVIHKYNCIYAQKVSAANREISEEQTTSWLKKGYSCCDYCHPENRKALDFEGEVLASLKFCDWSQTVTDIAQYAKDAGIAEETKKGITLITIPIDAYAPLRISFDVSFNFSLDLEASASYDYFAKNVFVVGIKYDSKTVKPYSSIPVQNNVSKNELTLMGHAKVKTGLGVTGTITFIGLDPWVNAKIGAEAGAYAELSGVYHESYISDEDYSAAYMEIGLYLDVTCSYKFLKFSGNQPIYTNEWPLLMYGYEKAYYAFDSSVDELIVSTSYDLSKLLRVKYFDLTDMKQSTELLNVKGESGKYTVNISLENGKYFEVKNGVVTLKGEAPCTATDTLIITVVSTTPQWTKYNVSKSVYYLNEYEITIVPGAKIHEFVNGICKHCNVSNTQTDNHTCTTEWRTTIEATCSQFGEKINICTKCGKIHETQQVKKLEHNFDNWKIEVQATEEKEGSQYRTCTLCGLKETSVIPKLTHTHKYSDKWSSNATDHWKECNCGNKSATAGHNYGNWTTTKEATESSEGSKYHTCKTCSYKETVTIPVLSHTHSFGDWKNNDTSHWKECRCGEKSNLSTHTYGNWQTITAATCASLGAKKHTCTACGYSETESVSTTDHNYGGWKSDSGTHWKECSSCGVKSNTASHTFGAWTTVKSATCSSVGTEKHTCTACGYSETSEIPMAPHSNGAWMHDSLYHWKACTKCGNISDKSEHSYTSVVTPPTDTEQGFTTHTCDKCGDNYVDSWTDPNAPYSTGLEYFFYNDGSCEVIGIGTCKDKKINIPPVIDGHKVTSIGVHAFNNCTDLTSITIPDSVTTICQLAFHGCTNLTSVTFGKGVTTIYDMAFDGCTSLINITIPKSVTTIFSGAFIGCSGLTSITVEKNNSKYYSDGNCIIEKGTNKLVVGCKNSVIPNSVTTIGGCAFSGCTGLISITIPDSVTMIGGDAFYGCTGLTSITIPDSVTIIGSSAFGYCTSLTNITIPDSVTEIAVVAFYGCTSLTSITIPDSVTEIGVWAFYGCTSLANVYYTGSEVDWNKINIDYNKNVELSIAKKHYNS